jgi:serine/threonine protein kinase/Tol biopolymer transport system component
VSLEKGARLGPYEILGALGAGGMGEVYRAHDARLGREVAIKVLPAEVADRPELLRRFEREARSASALNHPNVVTIFDAGREGEVSYLAMEIVDGTNLRDLLDGKPMALRRLLAVAMQIADGLAAAHEHGIVHRDLKPENIMVDRQGRVKILDFGLAKDVSPSIADEASPTITLQEPTREGTILGTAGYMSPEQASGKPVDFHTDQFSFGAILYEMATGARAFRGATPVETLASVIRDEPPPIRGVAPEVPTPLVWVVDRCLAKAPIDRYGSTRDLARDLANLREGASQTSAIDSGLTRPLKSAAATPKALIVVLGGVVLLTAAVLFERSRIARPMTPVFDQVTFRRGRVLTARFAPGGDSIVYGGAWEGKPFEIFSTRGSGTDSRSLGLESADLLSISRAGEMAILVNPRVLGGFVYFGTLARTDLSGGAPREVLEHVFQADWTPDGKELAVSRQTEKGFVLELPPGKPLFSTPGWISHLRVSPSGELVAFLHHPVGGDDRGDVVVVDRAGKSRILSAGWTSAQGLAWRPDGREVWFTATRTGTGRAIQAVTLSGRVRGVAAMAASLVLQDIALSGRVLLTRTELPVSLVVRPEGSPREVNLTWLDASIVHDIAPDGKTVVFSEAGQGGGDNCSVFLRRVDQPQAIRLGEGWAEGLSPDGKSVLAIDPAKKASVVIYPVGPGSVRDVEHSGITDEQWAQWLPDGKRILFAARAAGRGMRIYVQSVAGGESRPITPEGVVVRQIESPGVTVSPDGRRVAVGNPANQLTVYPVESGPPEIVPGVKPGEAPVGWSRDGTAIFVAPFDEIPARVVRISIADGRRTPFQELSPSDPAGVASVDPIVVGPDGNAYAYSCLIYLSTLYVADGLR